MRVAVGGPRRHLSLSGSEPKVAGTWVVAVKLMGQGTCGVEAIWFQWDRWANAEGRGSR